MSIPRTELPLANDAEITTLVAQFEACSLPYQHWTHRAHLAVALVYARRYPFITALNRIRQHINTYNLACGDPAGYNETVTVMFLNTICQQAKRPDSCSSLAEELKRFSALCTIDWLYTHYSKARIWSAEAKQHYLPPDLPPG